MFIYFLRLAAASLTCTSIVAKDEAKSESDCIRSERKKRKKDMSGSIHIDDFSGRNLCGVPSQGLLPVALFHRPTLVSKTFLFCQRV